MTQVWVIEDSQEQVALLERKLEKMGWKFSFQAFANAAAALEQVEKCGAGGQIPALIVLDLGLPDESGMEVLKKIRQKPELISVPVLILTASGQKEDMAASFKSGATFYLKKPLDADLLHEVLVQLKATSRF